jgi:hypothetical protein
MANPIDLIVTQEAIKGVDALIAKVTIAREGLLELGNVALGSSKNVAKISTPSGLNINTSLNAQINADLQKQKKIIEDLHATIAKKAEQSRLAEIRLQQAREKAFDSYQKQSNKETALAEKNANAYNKTQAQINKLTVAYNDLAIRKARYNNLNDNEEKRLVTLSAVNEKYNGVLKQTDATIGKNQRNVGNYASGYNALGNSINQLSREAPAFANSINTGFMAISNNIPALFDAIGGINRQNKALAEDGKPTVGVLKQLAGALFSWQTLLSVGVTLLTVYGGKIIDYAFGLNEAQKAQKALNEEMSTAKNTVTSEIVQLQSLTAIVLDHTQKEDDRIRAYKEIKKTLPGLTSATYDQAISTGELTRVTDLYISSLIQKNIVEAEAKSIADSQTALNKTMATSTKERMGWSGKLVLAMSSDEKATLGAIKKIKDAEDQKLQDDIDRRSRDLKLMQENYLKTQAITEQYVNKPDAPKKVKEKKREVFELPVFGNSQEVDTALEKLKQLKKALEQTRDETSKNSTEFQQFETTIKAVNESIDFLTKGIDPIKLDIKKPFVEGTTAVINLKKETDNFMRSFVDEFASNSGFEGLLSLFDGKDSLFSRMTKGMAFTKDSWKKDTVEMMEGAQEMYNFIASQSQAKFEKEKERIEAQKEIAISYAGGSAVAIEKINKDAEKSKKEIASREAKAKQKQAIVNIAIDTAQAIMGLWANPGFPAAIPMTIAVGALGALQIGMVASQKIPQYFDGTDSHTGGLMLVNDGKGANYQEKVILPNGKEITPQGRNVLMNAPAGTKVLTHEQQLFEMMQSNGINMTANINRNNGMTANQMDAVLGKHFSNIKTHNTTFDKNGFKSYIQNGNSRTVMNQNRVSGSGISV